MRPTSDDDEESGAETDEGLVFRSQSATLSLADTLRNRLLGKGKGRARDAHWVRPITTAPGAACAGETETEGEDSVSACLSFTSSWVHPESCARRDALGSSPPSDPASSGAEIEAQTSRLSAVWRCLPVEGKLLAVWVFPSVCPTAFRALR